MSHGGQAYPATYALFSALGAVETVARLFAEELDRLQKDWARFSPSRSFSYIAEPDEDTPEDVRRLIDAQREARQRPIHIILEDGDERDLPPEHRTHWNWLDSYHRSERRFRATILKAKRAATAASKELDGDRPSPLDTPTHEIRCALQKLGGVIPSPRTIGPYPPSDHGIPALMLKQLAPITDWIMKLRAIVIPGPEEHVEVTKRRRGRRQEHDPAKDEKLVADWHASGMKRPEFEAARRLAKGDVRKAQDRIKARVRKQSKQPPSSPGN